MKKKDRKTRRRKPPVIDRRDTAPGRLKVAIGLPEPDPVTDAARAVLGTVTPEGLAATSVMRAYEPELAEWLNVPENRARLAKDPAKALRDVLPPSVLSFAEGLPRVPPELIKRLESLELQPLPVRTRTPAMALFDALWAYVAASPANLAVFNADIRTAIRNVDPNAARATIDEVIAAFDAARGIHRLAPVTTEYFLGQVRRIAP